VGLSPRARPCPFFSCDINYSPPLGSCILLYARCLGATWTSHCLVEIRVLLVDLEHDTKKTCWQGQSVRVELEQKYT